MDLGALIIVVGVGACVDALADIKRGKDPVVTLLAASFLLLILSALGRATGQYGIATALAFLYLLASVFKNYQSVPALSGLFSPASTTTAVRPSSVPATSPGIPA